MEVVYHGYLLLDSTGEKQHLFRLCVDPDRDTVGYATANIDYLNIPEEEWFAGSRFSYSHPEFGRYILRSLTGEDTETLSREWGYKAVLADGKHVFKSGLSKFLEEHC